MSSQKTKPKKKEKKREEFSEINIILWCKMIKQIDANITVPSKKEPTKIKVAG